VDEIPSPRTVSQAWSESGEGEQDERSMVWESSGGGYESQGSPGKGEGVICAWCWHERRGGGTMSSALWGEVGIINESQDGTGRTCWTNEQCSMEEKKRGVSSKKVTSVGI